MEKKDLERIERIKQVAQNQTLEEYLSHYVDGPKTKKEAKEGIEAFLKKYSLK